MCSMSLKSHLTNMKKVIQYSAGYSYVNNLKNVVEEQFM